MPDAQNSMRFRTRSRARFPIAAVVASLPLVLAACSGSGPQSALEPQGATARDIDGLWRLVFAIAVIVFILVAGVMVVAMIRFRERKGDDREPKQLHGNTTLEIVWTIIPAVLLAVVAVPTLDVLFDVRDEPEGARLDVAVVGHQWWWEFTYPQFVDEDGRPLTTANELHIPVEEEVYLTMTSADVIHSFWVPPLQGKRDLVPGRFTNLKFIADAEVATQDFGFGPGVVLGQCAEFCGLAHADMRIRVFVHTSEEFQAWVDGQLAPAAVPAAGSGLAAAGYETFSVVCTACHQALVSGPDGVQALGSGRVLTVDGVDVDAAIAPDLTHFGSRTTFAGASIDATREHLVRWLANPSDLKPMTPERNDIAAGRILGMPSFGLSDEEIDGLVELLKGWQ